MTTSSSPHSHDEHTVVTQPGDLIAAIPYILGFHPTGSLVVLALDEVTGGHVVAGLRADLPSPTVYGDLAEHLVQPLIAQQVRSVALIILCRHHTARTLPRQALITACEDCFARHGIRTVVRLWTSRTTAGGQWRCYDHDTCGGQVTDAQSSTLAAASTFAGQVTYDRRDDLAATLNPDSLNALAPRRMLLDTAERDHDDPSEGRRRLDLIRSAIEHASHGHLPSADPEIVQLTLALADHRVRDACMAPTSQELRDAAEYLWSHLTRVTPEPERANAASLLAMAAYLRGNGTLAGIALDRAHAANPHHRLTQLIRQALSIGLPPATMRTAADDGAALAEQELTSDSPTGQLSPE